MLPLVSINGDSVSVEDAVRRSIIHDDDFLQQAEESLLIRQYAGKRGIVNSDAELQLAADELRYQQGLESVEKLNQWISSSHQTISSLQEAVDGMLLRNKVRASIPATEIAAYYAEHKTEYELVELYSIRVGSLDKANELVSQINEGADFHALAVAHSEDDTTRHLGGYAGKLPRSGMTGEVEAAVFKAKVGAVVGPVKTQKGYNLFKVTAFEKPTLNDVGDHIRHFLFDQLLEKMRTEARISYPVLEQVAVAA